MKSELRSPGPRSGLVTDDAFLGGRLNLLQPESGFRSGLDAVLLAAAIPARGGEKALEIGLGAGVASLCLARRVSDLKITGLEIEPDLAALARQNAARNHLGDQLEVVVGDVTGGSSALAEYEFDHVYANPPYFERGAALPARNSHRAVARLCAPGTLGRWAEFCLRRTKSRGTVTFVHRADQAHALLSSLVPHLGGVVVFPLWPKLGQAAKLVIVQGRKGSRAPLTLSAGLVLHEPCGRFSAVAEAILRNGRALEIR